jgi:hypothetical protein
VIPDVPKHNFMRTVVLGGGGGGSKTPTSMRVGTNDCMQIVDHEEMVV